LVIRHVGQQRRDCSGKTKLTIETAPQGAQSKEVLPKDQGLKGDEGKTGAKRRTPLAAMARDAVELNTNVFNMKFNVAAAIMKPVQGFLSFFVYGQPNCENLSIGKLLGGGVMDDDNPMNLTLSRVVILACNGEGVNDWGLNIAHYPIKRVS